MSTKQEAANKIVASNTTKTRKEVISIIRTELGMSDAGASTYYYNATKQLAKAVKTADINEQLAQTAEAAAPKKFQASTAAKTGADHWSSDFVKRQKVLRQELDSELAKINLNDIPAFLRKSK